MTARRPLHNLHLVYCRPLLLTLYFLIVKIQSHLLHSLFHQICPALQSGIPDLSAPADPSVFIRIHTGLTYLARVLEAARLSLYLKNRFRNIVLIVELSTNSLLFLALFFVRLAPCSIFIFKNEEVAPAVVVSRTCVFRLLDLSHVFLIVMLLWLCCSSSVCH